MAGLSVVTVLSGAPRDAQAQENVTNDSDPNKIENYQEEVKNELQTDSTMAWQLVDDNKDKVEEESRQNSSPDEVRGHMSVDAAFSYRTIEDINKVPRINGLAYQESYDDERNYGGYYSQNYNTITDIDREERDDNGKVELGLLAHEAQHMHQHEKVNFDADMSLAQRYKLHCYKEIGANIAEVLQIRTMYKEAQTEEERDKILEKAPDFYKKAVKEGKINPLSEQVSDFDKEMKFIANEMTNYWMDRYASFYDKDHVHMTCAFCENYWNDKGGKPNDNNYNEGVSAVLTMGGIDFSKYLEKDIECYNKGILKVDEEIQKGTKFRNFEEAVNVVNKKDKLEYFEPIEDESLKGFSLEQRYELAVQKAFVEKMKESKDMAALIRYAERDDLREDDILYAVKRICKNTIDKSRELVDKLAKRTNVLGEANDEKFQEELRKIWTVENSKGEKVCLIDALNGKAPDLSSYVSKSYKLKKKDERSFGEKAKDYIKDKLGIKKKKEENVNVEYSNGIGDVDSMSAPDYERLEGDRSEVLYTNNVIDTRTDFLVQERNEKVQNSINKSIEFIQNYHKKKANDREGQVVQQNERTSQQQNTPSSQQMLNKVIEARQNSM